MADAAIGEGRHRAGMCCACPRLNYDGACWAVRVAADRG